MNTIKEYLDSACQELGLEQEATIQIAQKAEDFCRGKIEYLEALTDVKYIYNRALGVL